jgi:uncharacterized membrane protein YgaE (UPF0421/DUF939 family)
MTILASAKRGIADFASNARKEENLRYGAQLAAAVIVAYLIPYFLSLPEGFWAVMSALIIMRARTGSTLDEGWGRFKGALTGTLFGLLGVWLHTMGLVTVFATLAVIAVLAFIAGLAPALRSAPITALIILSSGGIAGHGPWQVAGLRILEIVIGIGAGLLVTWLTPSARSAVHFHASVAQLLRDVALQTARSMSGAAPGAEEKEKAGKDMRTRLGRLALLAASADTERRFARGKSDAEGGFDEHQFRRHAKLVSRTVQDAALFGRIYDALPEQQSHAIWPRLAAMVGAALNAAAEGDAEAARNALQNLAHALKDEPDAAHPVPLLQTPVFLLTADLRSLVRLRLA